MDSCAYVATSARHFLTICFLVLHRAAAGATALPEYFTRYVSPFAHPVV